METGGIPTEIIDDSTNEWETSITPIVEAVIVAVEENTDKIPRETMRELIDRGKMPQLSPPDDNDDKR